MRLGFKHKTLTLIQWIFRDGLSRIILFAALLVLLRMLTDTFDLSYGWSIGEAVMSNERMM